MEKRKKQNKNPYRSGMFDGYFIGFGIEIKM